MKYLGSVLCFFINFPSFLVEIFFLRKRLRLCPAFSLRHILFLWLVMSFFSIVDLSFVSRLSWIFLPPFLLCSFIPFFADHDLFSHFGRLLSTIASIDYARIATGTQRIGKKGLMFFFWKARAPLTRNNRLLWFII